MKTITTRLAGVTHNDAQENIKIFGSKEIGSFALVREPDNPHDKNAIRVAIGDKKLGYIPKAVAKDLAPQIDAGKDFLALFVSRNEHPVHDIVGLTVKIVEVGERSEVGRNEHPYREKATAGRALPSCALENPAGCSYGERSRRKEERTNDS